MKRKTSVAAILLLAASILLLPKVGVLEATQADSPGSQPKAASDGQAERVQANQQQKSDRTPPYYESVDDMKEAPKTLSPERFDDPATRRAYQIAQDNPKLLMQLPCYCPCDGAPINHKSLLDCFVDTHAAGCGICKSEALTAARLQKEGWGVEKIRAKLAADYAKAHHTN